MHTRFRVKTKGLYLWFWLFSQYFMKNILIPVLDLLVKEHACFNDFDRQSIKTGAASLFRCILARARANSIWYGAQHKWLGFILLYEFEQWGSHLQNLENFNQNYGTHGRIHVEISPYCGANIWQHGQPKCYKMPRSVFNLAKVYLLRASFIQQLLAASKL